MESYKELNKRQQQEFNDFPMMFAFSHTQLMEAMHKRGLNYKEDKDRLVQFCSGGFMLREDVPAFNEMTERHHKELQEAIEADLSGEGFIYGMFVYELFNHEYGYTGDITDTLEALVLTSEDIERNEALQHGLNKAIDYVLANTNF